MDLVTLCSYNKLFWEDYILEHGLEDGVPVHPKDAQWGLASAGHKFFHTIISKSPLYGP